MRQRAGLRISSDRLAELRVRHWPLVRPVERGPGQEPGPGREREPMRLPREQLPQLQHGGRGLSLREKQTNQRLPRGRAGAMA